MKTILVALIVASTLTGCASWFKKEETPPPVVATKLKYVVVTIPNEMLEIPGPESRLDTGVATDKETARWMNDWERRYQEVERRLKKIKEYQDKKLQELKIPPEDVIKN